MRPVFPTLRLFLTCWVIYAAHWAPFMIREQFPAITLATEGTMNVQRFLGWTTDVFPGPRGGAFINNNPGASLLGAIPLILARPALDAVERWNDTLPSSYARASEPRYANDMLLRSRREWYFMAVAFLTCAGVMAPLSALTVTTLGRTLWLSGVPRTRAIEVALLVGFATPVFVRTGYLNHNLLVSHAGLLAGLLLWADGEKVVSRGRFIAAGMLGGFAVLCDYSGVLVLAAIGIYALLRARDRFTSNLDAVRAGLWYTAGAIPFLIALGAYQWWAFGHSVLPSQHFMTAIEQTNRGYRGMDWPSFELFTMNLFDPRFGLFAVCPVVALALIAPFMRRGRFRLPAREMWGILAFFAAFTLFCAANQYSSLQWNTGIRYLVPAIPGLFLLSAQVLQDAPTWLRRLVIAVSLALSWVPAVTHQQLYMIARHPASFQLAWVHRMADYGAVSSPMIMSAGIIAAVALVVALVWRRELVSVGNGLQTVPPASGTV